MPTPPSTIIHLVATFASAFSAPTFTHAVVLVWGAILAPGRRTVSSALRSVGRAHEPHFATYHQVLSRAVWSPWMLSRLLLALIIEVGLEAEAPLVLLIDETLERRRSGHLKHISAWRDPVRSSLRHVSTVLGIRWLVLAVVVRVPWSTRAWALPFMVVPARSPKTSERLHRPHRPLVGWAEIMLSHVRRWQPSRAMILVGDHSYAAVSLIARCQAGPRPVTFVSRLRLDAGLYDPPGPRPSGKSGPPAKKGARQATFDQRLADPTASWQTLRVGWYGGSQRELEVLTGSAVWYVRGHDPVPLRWVLVRCPSDPHFKPTALLCSDPTASTASIVTWFVARWNLEVTFEEMRAHLGFETQRGWSERTMERTTPCLFGLFSLVVLMAYRLHADHVPLRQAAWYPKSEATFSDVLAAVRRALWTPVESTPWPSDPDQLLIARSTWQSLLDIACYST